METAILFLIFNRPCMTLQVFNAIRKAKPSRLYVAADGPRTEKKGESELCLEARNVISGVDWPCQIKTLYRDKNIGCKNAVYQGITWFFEHEEEGIILEDDILPLPSFFPYCEELLIKYRNNQKIMVISGCNLVSNHYTPKYSYTFSKYNQIWGWASWRRAWCHYDIQIRDWPKFYEDGKLHELFDKKLQSVYYWRDILNAVYLGKKFSCWDYQWAFTVWKMNGLAVRPATNLTHNIGFGSMATHTLGMPPKFVIDSIPENICFPLRHPPSIIQDKFIDNLIGKHVFYISDIKFYLNKIKNTKFKFLSIFNKIKFLIIFY
jgi:hypothetical protein